MHISWKGQSCFQVLISDKKSGEIKLIIDPFDEKIGLKLPKMEADILLVTHDHFDHNNIKAIGGNPFLITGPGEYEVKGVSIQGFYAFHDKVQGKEKGKVTCYIIEAEDDLRICHLSDIAQPELSDEQLRLIGDVDVLMIPVGNKFSVSSQEASKIINQIEPKIVIPMHYNVPKLNIEGLDGVDKFLKAMGAKEITPQPKLSLKKKDLVEEETKIVVLEP